MRIFLRMKCKKFVLAVEIPCEWEFATKFADDLGMRWLALTLQPFFFLEKKKQGNPRKKQGFSLRGTPEILGK